jgi:uncharacterized protein (DUF885 family)
MTAALATDADARFARLGAGFDLRAFHDAVLALGSVPLAVLEAQVDAWIAGRLES